jgi:hypothetical protein
VSEATGADIEHLGPERGHRTLTITRKSGKVVTIPLAPRTARAIDLAIGERTGGPVFLASGGRRLDRHGAGQIVRRVAHRAGITKNVGPHTLRHAFITAALDAGSRCATCRKPLPMRTRGPPCDMTEHAAAWTATPPILPPPTSQAPPDSACQRAAVPPGGYHRQADSRKALKASSGNRSQPSAEREPPFGVASWLVV